ncbi:uncharacterized protein MYCFIDRAFT_28677 [Pseudocercospora fijiensis CIRAD86]|uniref:Stress-response A/B barrel domain-containing protein n=1 Tax=Pseudocercospora fijiensis (strain CIRAD86) TaxID=383855 RepID=N1Q976_PSEFD|nr:uncharacterized protein MYCFIDRAFT_28677 [Pseudocercospora fijiensis CIRAD86]EME89450.1 hypothetical protein MYCFIDRAFT_28677 [Pseudocercospora fijiensis CIRAD86]
MPILHIVLFEFSPTATDIQIKDICTRMLSLSQTCLHPTSNLPYVKSYGGGKDTSPEGLQGGFSHGFVSEFQNEEDREFYLERDPVHLEFVKSLEGIVVNVRVVDFEPGKF